MKQGLYWKVRCDLGKGRSAAASDVLRALPACSPGCSLHICLIHSLTSDGQQTGLPHLPHLTHYSCTTRGGPTLFPQSLFAKSWRPRQGPPQSWSARTTSHRPITHLHGPWRTNHALAILRTGALWGFKQPFHVGTQCLPKTVLQNRSLFLNDLPAAG